MILPLAKKYTMNLDKLELMLTQDDLGETTIFTTAIIPDLASLTPSIAADAYCSNGVALSKHQKCNDNNYHLAYDIIINKDVFGVLLMNRTKFYESDCDLIKLKVNNTTLYKEFVPNLNKFLEAFRLQINNITCIDIALDTNVDLLSNFYNYFRNPAYILKGGAKKLEYIEKYCREYRDGMETPTLYLGKSDKKLRIYNKSVELFENDHKDYISEFHKANGLDVAEDIYRMEISLKNTALKRYTSQYRNDQTGEVLNQYQFEKNSYNNSEQNFTYTKETTKSQLIITPEDYTHTNALASIFKTVLTTVCQFKVNDNPNITRCTNVELIDFSNVQQVLYSHSVTQSKKRDKNKMKQEIKTMLKRYNKTQVQSLLVAAYDLAKSQELLEYYDEQLKAFGIDPKAMHQNKTIKQPNFVGLFDNNILD